MKGDRKMDGIDPGGATSIPRVDTKDGRGGSSQTKVVIFSAYFPSHGGGMELACADLAGALHRAGMRVEWVSQADGEPGDQPGIKYTPVTGTDFIYALSGVPLPIPMPWSIPAISRAINRADVAIVAEANFILSAISFLVAKWNRTPTLLIQHVGEPSTVSKLARFVMRIGEALVVRPMVRSADTVICVSPVVARHFAGIRTKSDCLTIGHGLDLNMFRPSIDRAEKDEDRAALGLERDRRIAAFVGRLTESKGVSIIAGMAARRPDWTFVIAGTGPIDPRLWNLANVKVLGHLGRDQVAKLYRASDVTVLPSPSESFSLVVREALAAGCRVLCSDQILETDAGLRPFIVTERVDLGHPHETAGRFAAALDRCPTAPASEARAYVMEHCSPAHLFGRYIGLIEEMKRRGETP